MGPVVQSLDEFLGARGLSSPISDFIVDKVKIPHGLTQRQHKALEKEAAEAARKYSDARKAAIKEYNSLLLEGKIKAPSTLERLLKAARGHEDNAATHAARRALQKRGVNWQIDSDNTGSSAREAVKGTSMKATEIKENTVNMANCDWIIEQAKQLKALLSYNSDSMISLNKVRALSAIDTAMSSLRELKAYIEERSEQHSPLASNMDKLPAQCYAVHNETGSVIIVKKGETGYYNTSIGTKDATESREIVDEYNAKLGVSKAQAAAMYVGSMFGFHVPGADPDMYDENGATKRPSLDTQIQTAQAHAVENRPPECAMTAIRVGYGEFSLYPNEYLEGITLRHGGGQVKVDGVIYELQRPLSMSDCIKFDQIPYQPKRHKVDDYFPHRDSYDPDR